MVREFHDKAGAIINDKPALIDPNTCRLRCNLIQEELDELADAMGLGLEGEPQNLVEVADALGDLLYVVLGTAVSFGIDIEPIFEEIHRSNLTKFIDGYRRGDGKWVKGPSYTSVNLKPILEEQSCTPVSHTTV